MRKKIIILFVSIFTISVLAAIITRFMSRPPAIAEKIRLGVSFDPSSASIFIAYKKGFFLDEGLDVSLKMHTTGKAALESMYEGRVRFATIADTVLMFAGINDRNIAAIATISDSNEHHKIIGLTNRGISEAGDVRGKRIGVTKGTTGEFFLHSFLLFHGIPDNSVTRVDIKPENMAAAFEAGEIDAAATWPPTVGTLLKKFGAQAVVFSDNNYLMTWNIVGKSEFIAGNPELVKKILNGLLRAQRFMRESPVEAIAITSDLGRFDRELLARDWGKYNFDIRISEVLLINLEDQARWALKNLLQKQKEHS